jgi:hypothetical protein
VLSPSGDKLFPIVQCLLDVTNREQQTAILRADVQLSVMNQKCKRILQLKSPQWTLTALIPEPCLHKLCEVSCALLVLVKTWEVHQASDAGVI